MKKTILSKGYKAQVMKNIQTDEHLLFIVLNLNFQKDVSLANDDLLGDLMEELHQGPSDGMMKPLPIKLKKKGFSATKSVLNV